MTHPPQPPHSPNDGDWASPGESNPDETSSGQETHPPHGDTHETPASDWGTPQTGGYSAQYGQGPGANPPGQYGQYGTGSSPQGSEYIDPAKPGIIALRPLSLGDIYDGAFKAIRSNPLVMFVFAGVVVGVVAIIEAILTSTIFDDYMAFMNLVAEDPEAIDSFSEADLFSMLSGSITPLLLSLTLSFVATTALNGILTLAVSQAVLGYKPSLGEVWGMAKGQLLRLLALVLLIFVATLAIPGIFAGLTFVLLTQGSFGLALLLVFLTILVTIAWGIFVMAATALSTPALMLEKSGVFTALRRGWQLAKPSFFRVLGIYLLTMILATAVTMIVTAPVSMFMTIFPLSVVLIGNAIASAFVSAIITPFTAAVLALLYIDIRIRREGLADELTAAAAQ